MLFYSTVFTTVLQVFFSAIAIKFFSYSKTCASCDKKRVYTLTDENGRAFPVRRYVSAAGDCRFEVFNCAKLVGRGLAGMGKLLDCSAINDGGRAAAIAEDEEAQRAFYGNYTAGHRKKSVL